MGDILKLDGLSFLPNGTDITVAAGASSALSAAVNVKNDRTLTIQGYFTGAAVGQTAFVEFQLFGKTRGCSKYDTKPFWTFPIAATGTTEVVASDICDVADYEMIKAKIVNKDGTNGITAANMFWGAKRLDRGVYPR